MNIDFINKTSAPDKWTLASSITSINWNGVAYGNGKWVGVSETGGTDRVGYSVDGGVTWTLTSSVNDSLGWTDVVYGNGMFVAVAWNTNTAMYSYDGINWTSTTAAQNKLWLRVIYGGSYGNERFVAIARNAAIMYSTDGINWTTSTGNHASDELRDVTYGNGYYVAVSWNSSTNRVVYSTDGASWTGTAAASAQKWWTIAHGNGKFVAVALSDDDSVTNKIMYASDSDPTSWTAIDAPVHNYWTDVAYGDGYFVAVGHGNANTMYSTNGINWSTLIAPEDYDWSHLNFGKVSVGSTVYSRFLSLGHGDWPYPAMYTDIGVNDKLKIFNSTDAEDVDLIWSSATPAEENWWRSAAAYGNGKYVTVASGGTNRVMYSTDGISWTSASATEQNSWRGIAYGNGKFVAVSQNGTNRVMYSTDGITWSNSSISGVPNTYSWQSVVYGNGKFVAVASSGGNRVMYSTDGINWTSTSAAQDNSWVDITYGNGKYVAVSYDGTSRVMYSTDAINWSSTGPSANSWWGVTYGDGKFVSVSSSDDWSKQIIYSYDGITWTGVEPPAANQWFDVAYGNGMFIAVSNTGTNRSMYSLDAINWTLVETPEQDGWSEISYQNGIFLAFSNSGLSSIMISYSSALTGSFSFKPTYSLPDSNVTPIHIDPSNILCVNADNRIDDMNVVANLAGVTTISGSVGVGSTYPCTGYAGVSAYKPDWDSNYKGSIEFDCVNNSVTRLTWSKVGLGTPVIGYNTGEYGYSYSVELWWNQLAGYMYSGTNNRWYAASYYGGTIYGPEDFYEYWSSAATYRKRYGIHIGMQPYRIGNASDGYDYPGYKLNASAQYTKFQSYNVDDNWRIFCSIGQRVPYLAMDRWYHATFVYDLGNQLGDGIKLYGYLNGRLDNVVGPDNNIVGNYQADQLPNPMSLLNTATDGNADMCFGGNSQGTSSASPKQPPFGRLGQFRLYDRALTADEVLENYIKTKDRYEPDIGRMV